MEIETTLTRSIYLKIKGSFIIRSGDFYLIAAFIAFLLVTGFTGLSLITNLIIAAAVFVFVYAQYTFEVISDLFSKKKRLIYSKRHYIFSDDNIIWRTLNVEQIIQWGAFQSWEKVAGCYLLHFFNGKMIAILKSDIPAGEIQIFESMLREKIDKIITTVLSEDD